ncbi:MAG: sensor histidine kinase [Caldilineaceae bacterium]
MNREYYHLVTQSSCHLVIPSPLYPRTMLYDLFIIFVSLGYVGLLFAIARFSDQRADKGQSIINNPYVYALSMAIYCTAWTFYGSVGWAATFGIGFAPIYLGPTLLAIVWYFVLRKIVRISKINRITSIADFIASRYGKSSLLGGLVTVIAVIGTVPYIALQLKAMSTSFTQIWNFPQLVSSAPIASIFTPGDTPFYFAILLAAFAILFGTRHLDVTEHHEGLVAAVAFESIIKLVSFLAVGIFVTFTLFHGFGDLFQQAYNNEALRPLLLISAGGETYGSWGGLILLSMFAILFLPRQFQMAVVENMDERHIRQASWLFPLYLFVINIFVLPIALGGLLHFPSGTINGDTFVLSLPISTGNVVLAMFVFLGGFSAAMSMVIIETVALSTMVSNNLILPLLLRLHIVRLEEKGDLSGLLLTIRRVTIVVLLLAGYLYFHATASTTSLVSIGLISFAAVAQFAPALLGGIYWERGTFAGALSGLIAGFLIWGYTLPMPTLVGIDWLPSDFLTHGIGRIAWLRPYHLFGLEGLDPVSHSLFWSLLFNAGLYAVVSLMSSQSALEHSQANHFVNVFDYLSHGNEALPVWRGKASVTTLHSLLERLLGQTRADNELMAFARRRGLDWQEMLVMETPADPALVQRAEMALAGVMGAASARVAIASVTQEERIDMSEVMRMIDETSQIVAYSRQLEQRSKQLEQKTLELEQASGELRAANERLTEFDRLKDDFISTVTHELRTPLTTIRALSELMYDHPNMDGDKRSHFLDIVLKECERLTRLINQVLDLAKLESGMADWHSAAIDMQELLQEAVESTQQLSATKAIVLECEISSDLPTIWVDRDRVTQVVVNLLSNAIKFCDDEQGKVRVHAFCQNGSIQVDVSDNGPGLTQEEQSVIFEKFRQVSNAHKKRALGTGLGLPISARIVSHFGGQLWVKSAPGRGSTFSFTLPVNKRD